MVVISWRTPEVMESMLVTRIYEAKLKFLLFETHDSNTKTIIMHINEANTFGPTGSDDKLSQ
jgi:hypothetical protein